VSPTNNEDMTGLRDRDGSRLPHLAGRCLGDSG
jgi:hypothetical protein